MFQLFGRLMKLPLEAFVYSMEMFVKTMQGIQHIAYQGMDMMADWGGQAPMDASGSEDAVPEATRVIPEITHAVPEGASRGRTEATQVTIQEEERKMPDQDLRDDMLKLVRYKVLFVKRDYEDVLLPDREELVSENTDAATYSSWKIAEFIQDLDNIPMPKKWKDKNYPRDVKLDSPPDDTPKIRKLDEDDKKYLRVYFEVLHRYPRERFRYEERQIEVLEQIRDKMKDP